MNISKISKAVLSVSTAVFLATSFISLSGFAASSNAITLTSSKTSVTAGEKFDVTLGIIPNSTGVAGFTIDLHYDPTKVTVHVPTAAEENTYSVSKKYSVVTDYSAETGVVKIVGANEQGDNVTKNDNIAMATFTVKDGVSGKINYWVETEAFVAATDDGFSSASYSAPSMSNPMAVSISKPATTVKTTTTKVTTKASSTVKSTSKMSATTTTKSDTTTVNTTTKNYASAETVKTSKDETNYAETGTTSGQTTSAVSKTTAAETTTQAVTTSKVPEQPLYSYVQSDGDFNSEDSLQYAFKLSDYITDNTKDYNIKVNLSSTGGISGGIGLGSNGEWTSQDSISNGGKTTWTFSDVSPQNSTDEAYVQFYYVQAGTEMTIDSIEITPINSSNVTTSAASTTTKAVTSSDSESSKATTSTTTATSSENQSEKAETTVAESKIAGIVTSMTAQVKAQSKSKNNSSNPNTGIKDTCSTLSAVSGCAILFILGKMLIDSKHSKE